MWKLLVGSTMFHTSFIYWVANRNMSVRIFMIKIKWKTFLLKPLYLVRNNNVTLVSIFWKTCKIFLQILHSYVAIRMLKVLQENNNKSLTDFARKTATKIFLQFSCKIAMRSKLQKTVKTHISCKILFLPRKASFVVQDVQICCKILL